MEYWVAPLIILFSGMLIGLLFGLPMGFTLGFAGLVTGLIFIGPNILQTALNNTYGVMSNLVMISVPLFVFMAVVLEKSGIADDLYNAMHHWFGPLRGGLAIATILICTIIGAMSGIAAAGTVTMGLIALPIMLKKGYHKSLAIGPILVGGPLGILIPPSIGFIIYGMLTSTSIGRLFAGGIIPGLILVVFYCIYIGIRCWLRPKDGPPIPRAERISFKAKLVLIKSLILPIIIVLGVLGSIFAGIASPTEAAAVGALGAVISAIVYRKISWKMMKEAALRTFATTGMIMWILFGAMVFSAILITTGGPGVIKGFVMNLQINPLLIVFLMMLSYFILGCFLEETTMLFITIPIYMPILVGFKMDPVWFGVCFIVAMQMAYITPPFGFSLFFLKGIAPAGVSTGDVYRAVPPFLALQWACVLLVLFFPSLALWLPNLMMK